MLLSCHLGAGGGVSLRPESLCRTSILLCIVQYSAVSITSFSLLQVGLTSLLDMAFPLPVKFLDFPFETVAINCTAPNVHLNDDITFFAEVICPAIACSLWCGLALQLLSAVCSSCHCGRPPFMQQFFTTHMMWCCYAALKLIVLLIAYLAVSLFHGTTRISCGLHSCSYHTMFALVHSGPSMVSSCSSQLLQLLSVCALEQLDMTIHLLHIGVYVMGFPVRLAWFFVGWCLSCFCNWLCSLSDG